MNSPSRILYAFIVFVCCSTVVAQTGLAQTEPLKFSNNFFVTGDYVVGGWVKASSSGGFSTGAISIPDRQAYVSTAEDQRVPVGADVVAAFLYWSSVESVGTNAGQNGSFGASPVSSPMTGEPLGNPNAPVSWSSGGCVGSANGSKTMQVYRANVSAYLPVDANGVVQPNTTYQVRLADNKNSTVLGATLVIVYRILSQDVPLKAVVFYDGAYAPSNAALTMTQKLKGFFQPGDQTMSVSKFTAIVANGQSNKNETVSLNNSDGTGHSTVLPSLYGSQPPFPGHYNNSWDNPTWFPNAFPTTPVGNIAVQSSDSSETVVVVPSSSNKGCVSWGAAILSTTVQHSGDGILNVWKTNQGYCDPRAKLGTTDQGTCPLGNQDPNWVDLTGASSNQKDVFVQIDYMCEKVINNPDGTTTCDPSGTSYKPDPQAIANVASAFGANGHNVAVHTQLNDDRVILAQTCTDDMSVSPPKYCPFPGQAGVVGWKAGFALLKTQPLNYPDETSCATQTPPGQSTGSGPVCKRRFKPGQNNSYHEVIFGRASAAPTWALADGTLMITGVSGKTVTFATSSAHGLAKAANNTDQSPNARVTINDAVSNPSLNGTYLVQSVSVNPATNSFSFTIQTDSALTITPTTNTDPFLSITSGVVGTGSGVSDVGGADSLVSLGLWGADGQAVGASSGTLMHEVGHSIGLTHGGLYSSPTPAGGYTNGHYAVPDGGYSFVFEANCKSNFRTVMNYLFQVDLLDGQLDYSEDVLAILHENVATAAGVLSDSATTKWYSPVPPPVGSAATSHCDGTPLSPLTDPNPTMYRLEGPSSTLSWAKNQDINFDGATESALQGFDDWSNIELRQVGATGNDFWSGGSSRVGGGSSRVGGGSSRVGGGSSRVGGGSSRVGGGSSRVGGGVGEIDFRAANSVVRKPSDLTVTLGPQNSAIVTWTPPTFAQGLIAGFNVYRSKNGGPFVQLLTTPTSPIPAGTTLPLPTRLSFPDTTASCTSGNYTYFVTTIIADTSASGTTGAIRESLASNQATCGK